MPKVIDDKNVFRAVIAIMSASGYESATTKNIADAAGIHEATLFRKYGNKFNLIEQAIKAQFLEVPLAKIVYTGGLQADLVSIINAYLKTSEIVGNILPILLIEIPRNLELEKLLDIPWENITRISRILEKYQAQGKLIKEPVLNMVSDLLGPLMIRHFIKNSNLNLPRPPYDPHFFVDKFLHGRGIYADINPKRT